MTCCFSHQEIPSEKLLVLYYPPSMAHYGWDKSVYASARAREALGEIVRRLKATYWKDVVGSKFFRGLAGGLVGLILAGVWVYILRTSGVGAGIVRVYILPVVALGFLAFARWHLKAFLRRRRLWQTSGEQVISEEIRAIESEIAKMPDDPSAEQAATVLRRQCPDVISEIAFDGSYFRAFTYMDFVMYPQLRHPKAEAELPTKHSLNRDAYYVGDVVYDGWRVFHKDQRDLIDPRFVGSGGRRGVI